MIFVVRGHINPSAFIVALDDVVHLIAKDPDVWRDFESYHWNLGSFEVSQTIARSNLDGLAG